MSSIRASDLPDDDGCRGGADGRGAVSGVVLGAQRRSRGAGRGPGDRRASRRRTDRIWLCRAAGAYFCALVLLPGPGRRYCSRRRWLCPAPRAARSRPVSGPHGGRCSPTRPPSRPLRVKQRLRGAVPRSSSYYGTGLRRASSRCSKCAPSRPLIVTVRAPHLALLPTMSSGTPTKLLQGPGPGNWAAGARVRPGPSCRALLDRGASTSTAATSSLDEPNHRAGRSTSAAASAILAARLSHSARARPTSRRTHRGRAPGPPPPRRASS